MNEDKICNKTKQRGVLCVCVFTVIKCPITYDAATQEVAAFSMSYAWEHTDWALGDIIYCGSQVTYLFGVV